MSATNRGKRRISADAYYTPIEVIDIFLNNYNLNYDGNNNILEPSAGCGNFIKAIQNKYKNNFIIDACELRQEEKNNLIKIADNTYIGNFLNMDFNKKYKYIIGNPPYSQALEFMEKCFDIADENTIIIMLLRTAFLESKKRYSFWKKHPLNGLYVLSKRPSFTGKGTDATSYSFFVWDNTNKQEIKII